MSSPLFSPVSAHSWRSLPRRCRKTGAVVLAFGAAAFAAAQPPTPSSAASTAERVQREEQDRQREQFRRDRESAQPPTVLEAPLPERPAAKPAGIKRDIRHLAIEGATHLDAKFRAELEARYTGMIGVGEVEQLLSDLTRYYVLRGYATTRAYLPEQDLTQGTLRVIVVEGRVERVQGDLVPFNVFPVQPGDLLNLRTLEQGIDNLNRLPANRATLDLQPGTQPGETIVAVKNEPGRRWRASGSFDNSGSRDTGRNQVSGTLTYDNPLNLADSISVTHRRAVPYHADTQASQSTSGSYSVPWGWHMLTLGGSTSTYALSYAAPSGTPIGFDGDSRSLFARLDRVLVRRASGQLNASATLTWRSSRNYLLHNLIGVSSRDTTTLDTALDYSTTIRGGFFTASLGLGAGLPIFGSLDDPSGLPRYAAHAQFLKGVGAVSYTRPFKIHELAFTFTSALNGQVSRDVLYGSDQLTVGGIYAVRGFDRTNLAGDVGYVWRNDLSMNFAFPGPFNGRFGQKLLLRPYVGLDHGHAWTRVDNPAFAPPEGELVGGALGSAVSLGGANVDLSYQRSLARPSSMTRETGRLYLRANFSF